MSRITPYKLVSACVLALGSAAQVSAQCSTVTSTVCYLAKQNVNVRNYQIGYENPFDCDDEIRLAASLWNAAGSRWQTAEDAQYWYGDRIAGTPKYQITFEPSSHMYTPTANAEAPYGSSVGSHTIDGKTIPVVNDSDMIINLDRWAAGHLECADAAPTASQYDLGRTITHEMGHWVGMNHLTLTDCATYQYGQPGKPITSLCTTEKNGAIRLYGTP